jgi:hypothetical protein
MMDTSMTPLSNLSVTFLDVVTGVDSVMVLVLPEVEEVEVVRPIIV